MGTPADFLQLTVIPTHLWRTTPMHLRFNYFMCILKPPLLYHTHLPRVRPIQCQPCELPQHLDGRLRGDEGHRRGSLVRAREAVLVSLSMTLLLDLVAEQRLGSHDPGGVADLLRGKRERTTCNEGWGRGRMNRCVQKRAALGEGLRIPQPACSPSACRAISRDHDLAPPTSSSQPR